MTQPPYANAHAKRILILEDDMVHYMIHKDYLQEDVTHTYQILQAVSLQQADEMIKAEGPFDCILVDYQLPDGTGIDFIRNLKAKELHPAPALILLTSQGNTNLAVQAMKEGVNDYLEKGNVDAAALGRIVRSAMQNAELQAQLAESQRKLEARALHDPLTGLPNRTLFEDRCETALHLCKRNGSCVAIIAIDFDDFKEINDAYGHEAGDTVLVNISKRIAGSLRGMDTLARLGGDEFCILLQGMMSSDGVEPVMRRIDNIVQTSPVNYQGHEIAVGLSLGVAVYPDHGTTYKELMKVADDDMYKTKFAHKPNMNGVEDKRAEQGMTER